MDPVAARHFHYTRASIHREFFLWILLEIIIPAHITQSINLLAYAITANWTRYSNPILSLSLSLFYTSNFTYHDLNAPPSGSSPGGTQWELMWKPWANLSSIPIPIYQSSADRSWYYCSQCTFFSLDYLTWFVSN